MHLDGGGLVTVPTYDNHGNDTQWIENDLKMVVNTTLYRAASIFANVVRSDSFFGMWFGVWLPLAHFGVNASVTNIGWPVRLASSRHAYTAMP